MQLVPMAGQEVVELQDPMESQVELVSLDQQDHLELPELLVMLAQQAALELLDH